MSILKYNPVQVLVCSSWCVLSYSLGGDRPQQGPRSGALQIPGNPGAEPQLCPGLFLLPSGIFHEGFPDPFAPAGVLECPRCHPSASLGIPGLWVGTVPCQGSALGRNGDFWGAEQHFQRAMRAMFSSPDSSWISPRRTGAFSLRFSWICCQVQRRPSSLLGLEPG